MMQMQWLQTDHTANNADTDINARVGSNSLLMFMSLLQECKTTHYKTYHVLLPSLKHYLQDI